MRGIPGDTDDGAEANDPLIGASVEPVRRTPTPLMPEEVDAIRTAYAGGVSTGFGSESGQRAITVTEAEAVRAKLLAMAWGLSSAGRGRSRRYTVADGLAVHAVRAFGWQAPTPPAATWSLRRHYSVLLCTSSQ